MASNQILKQKRKALLRRYLDTAVSMIAILSIAVVLAYARLSQSLFVNGTTTLEIAAAQCTQNLTGSFTLGQSYADGQGGTIYNTTLVVRNNENYDIIWEGEIKAGADLMVTYGETTYANANGVAKIIPFNWSERVPAGGSVEVAPTLNVIDTPINVAYVKVNHCTIYEGQGGGDVPPATDPLTAITLRPSSAQIFVGETTTFTALKRPTNAEATLTWVSADPGIATVSQSGTVKGISEGMTTITVSSETGISASGTVTVNKPIDPSSIRIGWQNNGAWNSTLQFQMTVTNTNLSELKTVVLNFALPEGSVYTFWTSGISANGNLLTIKNVPPSGTLTFYGQIDLPNGTPSYQYTNPTITVESAS